MPGRCLHVTWAEDPQAVKSFYLGYRKLAPLAHDALNVVEGLARLGVVLDRVPALSVGGDVGEEYAGLRVFLLLRCVEPWRRSLRSGAKASCEELREQTASSQVNQRMKPDQNERELEAQ